ncbi:SubName: Full=Uncharacterized protein {ECO:0000313/EMBL:CCA77406.1} [Serendipita indica DSM 11827]|nr:SubName: Full=Uncharacterized protein {ECO:0000313/EMBL:CCA77406.1} [Serendipita indica DSM 11827]
MTDKPTFKTLWLEYLDAFNRHSLDDVFSYLSPNITLVIRGKTLPQDDRAATEKRYLEHWGLPDARISVIGDIEEVEGGINVVLVDHARRKKMRVYYVYAFEGDKWVHIRHEIEDIVDWDGD